MAGGPRQALRVAPAVAAEGGRPRWLPPPRVLPVRSGAPRPRRGRACPGEAERDRRQRRLDRRLPALRTRLLQAWPRESRARALLARRLRRRRVPALRRRDERPRDVWLRSLPARLGQGRRPGHARRADGARLQLRLQPELLVRPALGMPA